MITPREADILLCRKHQEFFCYRFMPEWKQGNFHSKLQSIVRRIVNEGSVRCLISIPPQHGKSEIFGKMGVPWMLGRNPKLRILYLSYSDDLPQKFSRRARWIMRSDEYQEVFHTQIKSGSDNIREWETSEGGAAKWGGIRAGVTGFSADVVIIDDPYKNRQEAESPTIREDVMEHFKSSIMTRLSPSASVVVVHTRWSPDDLIGVKCEDPEWEYINFPAIDDEGEPLFPERYSLEFYERQRAELGSYDFDALYQGSPRKKGGNHWKRKYIIAKEWQDTPAVLRDPRNWFLYFDMAFSEKETADYTASAAFSFYEGKLWCQWPDLCRIDYDAWKGYIIQRLKSTAVHKYGMDATYSQQPIVTSLSRAIAQELPNRAFTPVKAERNKWQNFLPLLAAYERGDVYHVGPGWEGFYEQLADFVPDGKAHDDAVDCMSMGWRMVTQNQTVGYITGAVAKML